MNVFQVNIVTKSTLFSLFLFLNVFTAQSQTVNDISVNKIDVEYIQIVGTSKLFSKKVTIQIDFGQNTKFFTSSNETQIKDKSGRFVKFNSMIDALNFMNSIGYHYLMKKTGE